MMVSLWSAAEEIALMPACLAERRDPASTLEPDGVRRRLANLAADPGNASAIRLFLHAQFVSCGLDRQHLDVLLDQLAMWIASGSVVLDSRPRRLPGATRSARASGPARPAELRATPADARTHWIRIKVVHDEDGAPLPGVRLDVRLPDASSAEYVTRADGTVEAYELPAGKCEVSCELAGARREMTFDFIRMGAGDGSSAPSSHSAGHPDVPAGDRIAHVRPHKVRTGETLDSIARVNGLTWQALAEFNWSTSVPDEINRRLRDEVGCTQKTADGHNYVFTDEDEPGILHVPTRWIERGLMTDREHVVRVRAAAPAGIDLVIPLEVDLDDDPDQDDEIRLRRAGGGYERIVKSSDPRVQAVEDAPLLKYPFDDVPPGTYSVAVRIGDEWYDVVNGLHVSLAGVRFMEERFEGSESGDQFGTPIPDDEFEIILLDDDPSEQPVCGC